MPRRSHKKSRQGCRECKRRHLKCDETKPKCVNCATANLECPYETVSWSAAELEAISPSQLATTSVVNTPAVSSSSRSPASSNLLPPPYTQHSPVTESSLNLVHLELLYWWSTSLFQSLISTIDAAKVYADTCVNYGLRHTFLMRQILAISALNLSIERPEHRTFYHQHAVELQSEAISGFTTMLQSIDESTIVAVFLGSSLMGMHSFCETFTFRDDNFNHTLDALIHSISLLRGIRAVIGGSWWEFLLASEIGGILSAAHERQQAAFENPPLMDDLQDLVDQADISQKSKDTYNYAIKELAVLHVTQQPLTIEESSHSANMIFGWLVVVGKDYTDLLSARRAEALIILAYYAVVLHRRRNFWAIGDAGKYLIDAIDAHLGQHWQKWLAWPRAAIASSTPMDISS